VCLLAAAALAIVHFREPRLRELSVRFDVPSPDKATTTSSLSPDGRYRLVANEEAARTVDPGACFAQRAGPSGTDGAQGTLSGRRTAAS
jgi:hypothetical protein